MTGSELVRALVSGDEILAMMIGRITVDQLANVLVLRLSNQPTQFVGIMPPSGMTTIKGEDLEANLKVMEEWVTNQLLFIKRFDN